MSKKPKKVVKKEEPKKEVPKKKVTKKKVAKKVVPKKAVPVTKKKVVPKKVAPKKEPPVKKIVPKKAVDKNPNKNSNLRVIGASVLISMILTSGGAFLILPIMFPGINGELQDLLQNDPRILQTQYLQIEPDSAEIYDFTTSWTKIADDSINISIRNNSQILVEYSTHYILGVSNLDPLDRVGFEIQIRIVDVASETQRIGHFNSDGYTNLIEFEATLNMNLLTSTLPEGEYSIVMYWRSEQSNVGSQYLILSNNNVQYNRTLYVHEVVNYA